jgi:hypothetical protein
MIEEAINPASSVAVTHSQGDKQSPTNKCSSEVALLSVNQIKPVCFIYLFLVFLPVPGD